MKEKDRYEIHIYDDVCVDLYNNGVLDKSINDTYKLEKLLNQQDKELSKLRASYQQVKEENQQLKQQLAENGKEIEKINACVDFYKSYYISFKGKVIDELEKVKAELVKLGQDYSLNWCGIKIYNFIDDQINELKEGKQYD